MLSSITRSYYYLLGICAFAITLIIVFSYIYWTLPTEMVGKMGNYIQMITVFILMTTTIITVMTFKYQMDDRHRTLSIQYANLNENEINDIDKLFMNNPLLDRLYFEMYLQIPHVQKIKQMRNNIAETSEMLKAEQHMASIIFQKIADIYFCEQLEHNALDDSIEWINTFRGWLKSPILRSHWSYLKFEHHPSVQRFIDESLIGTISQ